MDPGPKSPQMARNTWADPADCTPYGIITPHLTMFLPSALLQYKRSGAGPHRVALNGLETVPVINETMNNRYDVLADGQMST